jgi:hypothetical protein
MESGPFIPHNIETGLKIALLIIIAAAVIRIYNKHPKKKSNDDYAESREFVLNTRQLRDEIKKNFTSLASRFRRKGRVKPVTLKEKIRYLYYSFLELDIKHGIYKNKSQTSREIGRETVDYLKDNAGVVENLTSIYENARYGADEALEEDYKTAAESFREIKNKLGSTRYK